MNDFQYIEDGTSLAAILTPWDKDALGFGVAQITTIKLGAEASVQKGYEALQRWCSDEQVKLVSCRLPHQELKKSFFLESKNFKFIEMVLHPQADQLQDWRLEAAGLQIMAATPADMADLDAIALTAFNTERFHLDPRIDSKRGDLRYARWVAATPSHPRQQLLKIVDADRIVGLFIVEAVSATLVYWHLTAINPLYQGQGYGKRVWLSMMQHHQAHGYQGIRTTIAARNYRVLNLYASLNFRFSAPEMTFHLMSDEMV
jgi:RimJ/RimL family protein N-acetyltransferase